MDIRLSGNVMRSPELRSRRPCSFVKCLSGLAVRFPSLRTGDLVIDCCFSYSSHILPCWPGG